MLSEDALSLEDIASLRRFRVENLLSQDDKFSVSQVDLGFRDLGLKYNFISGSVLEGIYNFDVGLAHESSQGPQPFNGIAQSLRPHHLLALGFFDSLERGLSDSSASLIASRFVHS